MSEFGHHADAEAPLRAQAHDDVGAHQALGTPAPRVLAPARVKVCGITNLDDAELAVGLGAWALGMIFFDGSPRSCSLAAARQITGALRRRVELCGVFVNAPLEQVAQTSE